MKDNLLEHEVYGLLQKAGMSAPNWTFVKNGHSLSLATGEKYVAKIVKRDLLHKSDSGGIVFNVTSATAAQSKEELLKKFKDAEGVLFVEQIEYERSAELILGGYVDPFFGPLVTIGFGGTATDLFADIMKKGKAKAVFPAGLDAASVSAIVAELPIVKMVTGNVRGYKKLVDLDAILKAVGSIQKILNGKHDGQEVEEIEVNPLVCADGKLWALDGVCRTRGVAGGAPAKPLNKIGSLLNPKSACIVGASGKNPYNPANVILKNLLSAGIPKEKMFLVHPKEDEIEGIKCEKSLADVVKKNSGLPVDLFVVGVPAKTAATLMEECFALNAANAIQVISAGFGETEGGRELQLGLENKLARLDRNKRPVINGPNTLGNIYKNVKTLFTSPKKNSGTGKGHENAALICQSGAFMITAISNMAGVVSPKVSMSVGNQMDVSVVDCLEYLYRGAQGRRRKASHGAFQRGESEQQIRGHLQGRAHEGRHGRRQGPHGGAGRGLFPF
jgi:predicted CoA-binding protein